MGKNELRLLRHAIQFPGWCTYAKDRATFAAVRSLLRKGLIVGNEFGQFRLAMSPYNFRLIEAGNQFVTIMERGEV